jgi:hypothetical protein
MEPFMNSEQQNFKRFYLLRLSAKKVGMYYIFFNFKCHWLFFQKHKGSVIQNAGIKNY